MKKNYTREIKKLRFSFLETRRNFSKRLGITPMSITNWESGKRFPSLSNIKKMLDLALENGVPFNIDVFNEEEI